MASTYGPGSRFGPVVAAVDPDADVDRVLPVGRELAAAGGGALEIVTVVDDDAGRTITDHVSRRAGLLLVVGTSAWGPPGDRRLGPVTEHVLSDAADPVLVVGPHVEPGWTPSGVVAVVDGSTRTDAALEAALRWARTFPHGAVRLVEVVPPDGWPDAAGDAPAGHLEPRLARCAEHGVHAEGTVLRERELAPAVLRHVEREGGMLVVVTPRWPGAATHWFASARRLVSGSTSPVLVVPVDQP